MAPVEPPFSERDSSFPEDRAHRANRQRWVLVFPASPPKQPKGQGSRKEKRDGQQGQEKRKGSENRKVHRVYPNLQPRSGLLERLQGAPNHKARNIRCCVGSPPDRSKIQMKISKPKNMRQQITGDDFLERAPRVQRPLATKINAAPAASAVTAAAAGCSGWGSSDRSGRR